MWLRSLAAGMLLATAVMGCGGSGTGQRVAVTPSAVPSADEHDDHEATAVPISAPLPPRGLVVAIEGGVRLLALDGSLLAELPGLQLFDTPDPTARVQLLDASGRRLAVGGGLSSPAAVPAASSTSPAGPPDCRVSAVVGTAQYLVCHQVSGRVTDSRPATVEVLSNGRRRVLSGPPYRATSGETLGHWRWVLPSPDGRTLLAQWSGECEVPQAFLISVADGAGRRPEGGAVAAARETVGLGWLPSGEVVVDYREGVCGSGDQVPGIYVVTPMGERRLSTALQSGSRTVRMWS